MRGAGSRERGASEDRGAICDLPSISRRPLNAAGKTETNDADLSI